MAWVTLDEARASSDTVLNHVDDHNQLHVWGNRAHASTFNVLDYGAVGDGVTVDTAAIQAAIDAAGVSGGSVFFPALPFISGPLTVPSSSVGFEGVGWFHGQQAAFGAVAWDNLANTVGSRIIFTNTTGPSLSFSSWSARPVIRNLLLVGSGSGTPTGISGTSVTRVRADNVGIVNFSVGLALSSCYEMLWSSTHIVGCATGITLSGATNQNVFVNTEIQKSTVDGIVIDGSSLNAFYGGLFQNIAGSSCLRFTSDTSQNNAFSDFWVEAVTATNMIDLKGAYNTFDRWQVSADGAKPIPIAGNLNSFANWRASTSPVVTVDGFHNSFYNCEDLGIVDNATADTQQLNLDVTKLRATDSIGLAVFAGWGFNAVDQVLIDSTGLNLATVATQKVGFYGKTPVAQQTGVAVSAAGIHAALVASGLITA